MVLFVTRLAIAVLGEVCVFTMNLSTDRRQQNERERPEVDASPVSVEGYGRLRFVRTVHVSCRQQRRSAKAVPDSQTFFT